MLFITFLVFLAYCGYLVYEKKANDRYLRSFKYIIHVNGIRGKTTTCRLIDAALRGSYKVFTKTTGTTAFTIDTQNVQHPIKRRGSANIKEQLSIIRQAYKEGAEVLIIECMAINPTLQKACQDMILKSNISVITNVRYDHLFDMGNNLDEIAEALSAVVPKGGTLYTSEMTYKKLYQERCHKRQAKMVLCPPIPHRHNVSLALAIAQDLGVSRECFEARILHMTEDYGTTKAYTLKNPQGDDITFLNLFSVNDPQSTFDQLTAYKNSHPEQPVYFLYNSRSDRPERCLLFARYGFAPEDDSPMFIVGSGKPLAQRLFSTHTRLRLTRIASWQESLDIPANALLVGIGNIKGPGYEMVALAEKENEGEIPA